MKVNSRKNRAAVATATAVAAATLGAAAAVALSARLWKHSVSRKSYTLRGKNVVITGGSRGLGLALAREFLRKGATVALLARNAEELQTAKRSLASRNVFIAQCDVTSKNDVDQTIEGLREQLGQIDVLVNNAGIIAVGPLDAMTLDDFQQSLDTHFWGPLYTTLAVLPEMTSRREGRIVNISSIGGKISVPHLLPYSVGKFALGGFSEGIRSEARRNNVLVTTAYPGLLRTGSPRNATFKGKHRAEFAWFSLSDALPLLSINADRAAQQIVAACERGDARLIVSLPAKIAIQLHEIAPELSASLLALSNRLLPNPGGIGTRSKKGADSGSLLSPSWLTALNELAAKRNNEVA